MFKALKEKLFSVRQRLETTIVEQEPLADEGATASVPFAHEPALSDTGSTQVSSPSSESPEKKSPSLAQKVVSLVRDREFIISSKDIEDSLSDLEIGLLESDVAFSAADAILTKVREDLTGSKRKIGSSVNAIITHALSDALLSVLGEGVDILEFIKSHEKPVKILFTGVNGTGKTTSVAKVAHFLTTHGCTVAIGAGDTFRAGA
ncbi:MAG: signal recognition particle receptor subunit alpha, partial [Methanobacteriota archaeon]